MQESWYKTKITDLISFIENRMHETKTLSVGVMVNDSFGATLFVTQGNVWRLDSPERSYTKSNPSVEYLLRKYAKLMDPEFLQAVGPEVDHDDDEAHVTYEDSVSRYIDAHKLDLLYGLLRTLSQIHENLR